MVRKTREESENTKKLILKSALNCFYEKGFSRTTFEDIATCINLTKGAVYWHFKNKAELLSELIRQQAEENRRQIGEQYTSPDSVETLRRFFQKEAEYIERTPEVQKFNFFILFQVEWSDNVFNQVQAKTGKIRNFHFKTVKHALTAAKKNGEIAPDTDIKKISVFIVSTWLGLIHTYTCKDEKFSLSQVFLEGFDMVIEKIRNYER